MVGSRKQQQQQQHRLHPNSRRHDKKKLQCKVLDFFMYLIVIVGLISFLATYTYLQQQQQTVVISATGTTSTTTTAGVVASSRSHTTKDVAVVTQHHEKDSSSSSSTNSNTNNSDDINYRFIVSSECSSYQLWETITLLHSAEAVGQCGKFTWIISGCLPDDKLHLGIGKSGASSDLLTPQVIITHMNKHFQTTTSTDSDCSRLIPELHFTPDYSNMTVYDPTGPYSDGKLKRFYTKRDGSKVRSSYGNRYVFNNKPNGLLHWAKAKSHVTEQDPTTENEVIVLIDPDFLFLTKFTLAGNRNDLLSVVGQDKNSNTHQQYLKDADYVHIGQPAAASYGLGSQWLDFNLTKICGKHSFCGNTTHGDVRKYYSAGPPYIIHRQDILPLATKWVKYVPLVYEQYPLLYAEMYAYSIASAHLQLKHTLINGLFTGCMVGWPKSNDASAKENAIAYQTSLEQEVITGRIDHSDDIGAANTCFNSNPNPKQPTIPIFLHYCNRYFIETTPKMKQIQPNITYRFFAKRRIDHKTVLQCPKRSESVKNDDASVEVHGQRFVPFTSDKLNEKMAGGNIDWNTLAVCAITRSINYARIRGGCTE